MNGFGVLLQKEWREAVRSAKLIWLPAVFLLLGLIQALTAKYLPDIIASAGNLPEGTVLQIPIPKPGEVLAETLGQFGTIGLLAVCLAFMGTISAERRSGTAAWILVKPVSQMAYVTAKWVMQSLIIGFSFILGYGAAWYYTVLLIGAPDTSAALSSGLLYGAWLIFIGTVTLGASSLFSSPAAAAFIGLGSAAILQLLRGLFDHALSWLPSGLNTAAVSALSTGESMSWAGSALAAFGGIALILLLAVSGLNKHRP